VDRLNLSVQSNPAAPLVARNRIPSGAARTIFCEPLTASHAFPQGTYPAQGTN
jgi:hypothetical protein